MIPIIVLIVVINTLFHVFLDRFFQWYSGNTSMGRRIFMIFMLVPPLSIVVSLTLLTLGSLLYIAEKIRKK